MKCLIRSSVILACLGCGVSGIVRDIDQALTAEVKTAIDRGLRYLWLQQLPDGSWEGDPALTGLVAMAFSRSPRSYRENDGPFLSRAARHLIRYLEKESTAQFGGRQSGETAAVILGLEALRNPAYDGLIDQGKRRLAAGDCRAIQEPFAQNLGFVLRALAGFSKQPLECSGVDLNGDRTGTTRLRRTSSTANQLSVVVQLHNRILMGNEVHGSEWTEHLSAILQLSWLQLWDSRSGTDYPLFFLAETLSQCADEPDKFQYDTLDRRLLIRELLNRQQHLGNWPAIRNAQSEVRTTAMVLLALEALTLLPES